MFEKIYKTIWYRGQMLDLGFINNKTAAYGKLNSQKEVIYDFMLEAIGKLEFKDGLFRHQAEALNAWAEGKDILITCDAGSGRRSTLLLMCYGNILLRGGRSIIIVPNIDVIEKLYKSAMVLREKLLINALVNISKCTSESELEIAISSNCNLAIVTAEILYSLITNTAERVQLRYWLRNLSFCGIHGVTLFSPGELAHLRMLISLLRGLTAYCQFNINALPMDSPENFCASLLGLKTDFKVISRETSNKAGYYGAMWFPPLKANPSKSRGYYTVKRENYVKEAINIISNLWSTNQVSNGAIWNTFGSFSDVSYRKITENIISTIQSSLSESNPQPVNLLYFETPENCPVDAFGNLDLLVLLGANGSIIDYQSQIANIIKNDGIVLIIIPDDPITYAQFRRPDFNDNFPQHIHYKVPFSSSLEKNYLNTFINLNLGNEFSLKEMSEICKNEELIKGLEKNNFCMNISKDQWIATKIPEIDNFSWGQLELEAVFLKVQNDHKNLHIDSYKIPFIVHMGSVIYQNSRVFRVDTKNNKLLLATEDYPLDTIPHLNFEIGEVKTIKQKSISSLIKKQEIKYVKCNLAIEELGYYSLSDYSSTELPQINHNPKIIHGERKTRALMIECPPAAEISTLLWQYFKLLYANSDEIISIFPYEQQIVIIALNEAFYSLLEDFYERYDLVQNLFFQFAYDILKSCPCVIGCSRCISPVMRRYRGQLSKEKAMRYIADILGYDNFDQDWKYKTIGLDPDQALKKYETERDQTVKLLSDRFKLNIKQIVPIKAVKSLGDGFIGLYDKRSVKILAPVKESTAVQVIAHEYAHNWAHDPAEPNMHPSLEKSNIPHKGKMISEGFAQWASFKICDHLSLLDEARQIKLWVDDEYGEGFDFLNWLENTISGYQGVLEFVTNGVVSDSNGEELTFEELYNIFKNRNQIG